ncbi:hypothetical protein X797_010409 [Metarhizium robertsii]|uniref:Secreted protein n=1 Tax=Metarhizium robertsii TaxID=568076 RepID=A0A0A1UP77_9HYPO|nr:hypothetical protein X797_010409 [Metarhizium robertsii]
MHAVPVCPVLFCSALSCPVLSCPVPVCFLAADTATLTLSPYMGNAQSIGEIDPRVFRATNREARF